MKSYHLNKLTKIGGIVIFTLFSSFAYAQNNPLDQGDFWSRVRFGGGLGLGIGSGYTDIMVAPSAVYDFNEYFSAGLGLQGSYVKSRNFFESYIYGASVIGLFNPINEIQLSAELEQVRVNLTYDNEFKENFWNTALFLGAGYRAENITIGVRYNVLHDEDRNVYNDAFMPFVRIYF
ncbi:hypothetical protein ACI6PS_08205 [Flavobacterium sp. PLA-1-15]|uniref:hypothetical protein n=1 Tax=Flavobacterium sp. PLA-1-15 TaxID=3380533 RepID=UPI003B7DF4D8